jgi:hypothetical protein
LLLGFLQGRWQLQQGCISDQTDVKESALASHTGELAALS